MSFSSHYILTSIVIKYSDGGIWVWRQQHIRSKVEIKQLVRLWHLVSNDGEIHQLLLVIWAKHKNSCSVTEVHIG